MKNFIEFIIAFPLFLLIFFVLTIGLYQIFTTDTTGVVLLLVVLVVLFIMLVIS